MRRLQVDLSGLWHCVERMGDPVARFMIDEENGGMQAIYRGKELLEIATRHDLDTYAYVGGETETFMVIGAPQSIRNLSRLVDENERLRELLQQAKDALQQASDHWMSDTMMAVLDDLCMELNRLDDNSERPRIEA